MRLVPDLAIKEYFLETKLDGCSFQAPHATPRPRLMETFFFSLFSVF